MTRSSGTRSRWFNQSGCWLGLFLFAGFAFACEGDVGPAGPAGTVGAPGTPGADGTDVDPATLQEIQDKLDELSKVEPESCATCHKDTPAQKHQDIYNQYTDTSALALTIIGVTSVDDGSGNGTFNSTMTFSITKGGLPYVDIDGLPTLSQKTLYVSRYEAGDFFDSKSFDNITATGTPGQYTATATEVAFQPEATNAVAYGYIADDQLDTASGGRVRMYNDVSNAGLVYGTVDYASPANVAGCVKCHGAPYMKHGYRAAEATNLPDFVACKTCHYDDRDGSHIGWQVLVDDPARYQEANANLAPREDPHWTAAELAKYAYTANIMNDVHMTHAMEFPYPQSMSTCATCHEGKLDMIFDDTNFTKELCRSCHALTGSVTYGTRDRSMEQIWIDTGAPSTAPHTIANLTDSTSSECYTCHSASGGATTLSDLHNGGYDPLIYTDAADGTRYSELFTVTVDSAAFNSTANTLTVEFSAHEDASSTLDFQPEDIVPTVMVGLYGWDTKDFLVSPHTDRVLEFRIDGVTTNARYTVNAAPSGPGSWSVTADLSTWATELGDGTVKRAEIGILPGLIQVVGEEDLNVGTSCGRCGHSEYCNSSNVCTPKDDIFFAVNAPSRTFDFATNAFDDPPDPENPPPEIVDVAKCNNCHDALATTFHSGDRGGNITVCRLCHVTTNGGSHLEMQSRSIDSYVHAIHSFQAFDSGDIDFSDPVEKLRYEHHIEHVFPNFTAKNCEGCHNAGMYGVPDQSKSMPGKLSKSDTWSTERNIPAVPSLITGPATRACGGCHRAHVINEDDANRLIAFNQHTNANGYMVEDETLADGTEVFDVILETIMSIFN